ncbi:MAG: 50S ribosomal protein L30e [Candidatus ainarchaeum sp.]|nr:50S ribosomal protein L30e [Candidatus ainarchaeum sp.]
MAKAKKGDVETEEKEEGIDQNGTDEAEPSEPAAVEAPGEAQEEVPKRKVKKAVKKRKSKKENENPLARAVRLAVETGKVEFGARNGVKDSLLGRAKLIVISENAPLTLREDVGYYSRLSEVPVLVFQGTSMELGSICGKPHSVSVLSVYEEGTSGIFELAKKK